MKKHSKTIFHQIMFLTLIIFLGACATTPNYDLPGVVVPQGEYSDVVEKWTDSKKVYSGIISTYQVTATLNSPEVMEYQLYLESQSAHRSIEQYNEARKAMVEDMSSQSTFFVMLYTAKDENNDLEKTKTSWNIFLDYWNMRHLLYRHINWNLSTLYEQFSYF